MNQGNSQLTGQSNCIDLNFSEPINIMDLFPSLREVLNNVDGVMGIDLKKVRDAINKDTKVLLKDPDSPLNSPGIYIYGFNGLIKNAPTTRVPYYVGIKTSILISRIKEHLLDILKLNSTYLRFSNAYMHQYFLGTTGRGYPIFPVQRPKNKQKPLNWTGWNSMDYGNHLNYYNNYDFISNIKGVSVISGQSDYPINLLPSVHAHNPKDTLITRILQANFWVWLAPVNKCNSSYNFLIRNIALIKGNATDRQAFEVIETFVKYSLKGITIGYHTAPLYSWNTYGVQINLSGCSTIFKPGGPSQVFTGNY